MKKTILSLVILVALCALPLTSLAASIAFPSADDNNALVKVTDSREDLLAVGAMVDIATDIEGDLMAFGSMVSTAADKVISGDLWIGGSQVNVESAVEDDLRAGGSLVTIGGNVGDDVIVGGGQVVIDGNVGGDIYAAAADLTIDGEVSGNVFARADKLILGENAVINGNLDYHAAAEVEKAEGAVINGDENFTRVENGSDRGEKASFFGGIMFWALAVIAMIIVMLAIVSLAPLKSIDVYEHIKKNPWRSIGMGLVFAIITPIAAIIVMFSMVGVPIALIVLTLYAIALYLSCGYFSLFVGQWLYRLFKKDVTHDSKWFLVWSVVMGVVVVMLIKAIPIVGTIIMLVGGLLALGAMFEVARKTAIKKRN